MPYGGQKLRILIEADRLSGLDLEAFLRRVGLSYSTLVDWRSTAEATVRLRQRLKRERLRQEARKVKVLVLGSLSAVLIVIVAAVAFSTLGDKWGGPKDLVRSNFNPNEP